MHFVYKAGEPIRGRLKYNSEDKSLDFDAEDITFSPQGKEPEAALLVSHYLQIEFWASNGRLLYAWGYDPEEAWIKVPAGTLELPKVKTGEVYVLGIEDVNPGMGYDTDLKLTRTQHYEKSGHLLIGDLNIAQSFIEIATNTIVGLKNGQLCCIVLKPER